MRMPYNDNPRSDRAKISSRMCVRSGRWAVAIIMLGGLPLIGGCQGAQNGRETRSGDGASGVVTADQSWGLVLEYFTGEGHEQQARARAEVIGRMLGREDVRVRDKKDASVVLLGSYGGPDEGAARRDLAWIHGVQVEGRQPWRMAYLTPPAARALGDAKEANLAFARDFFGDEAEFTLQIGVYQSANTSEARRAAEEAVRRLRAEGEEAFYYHGPSWSSVTVGLFGVGDYDEARGEVRNGEILELQARYPQNMLNGAYPIQDKNTGKAQRSLLVHVP